jgi:hypothetical protein
MQFRQSARLSRNSVAPDENRRRVSSSSTQLSDPFFEYVNGQRYHDIQMQFISLLASDEINGSVFSTKRTTFPHGAKNIAMMQ